MLKWIDGDSRGNLIRMEITCNSKVGGAIHRAFYREGLYQGWGFVWTDRQGDYNQITLDVTCSYKVAKQIQALYYRNLFSDNANMATEPNWDKTTTEPDDDIWFNDGYFVISKLPMPNDKIACIKLFREITKMDLKGSKESVDGNRFFCDSQVANTLSRNGFVLMRS